MPYGKMTCCKCKYRRSVFGNPGDGQRNMQRVTWRGKPALICDRCRPRVKK
jgi:hypothetical protein